MTLDVAQMHSKKNDEIDLIQLVKILWQGKARIIICAAVFTIIGVAYALMAQQWWTSNAVITKGQYQNTSIIRSKLTNVYAVSNSDTISELNTIFSSETLLNNFISEFNSYNNKQAFISVDPIMQKYAKEADVVSGEQQRLFAEEWNTKISAALKDKKEPNIYVLQFQGMTPSDSYELLKAYIAFTSQQVQTEIVSDLNAVVDHNKQLMTAKLISLESRAEQKIIIERTKTQYALSIAKAADANAPLPQMDNSQLFSIDLGSKGLEEKELILKNTKDLSLFEPDIGLIKLKLSSLDKVNLTQKMNFEPVRFLQNVDYPIARDKPKRVIIVMTSFFLGIIFGVLLVLIRRAFLKKND
ncbi:LPS O-antigen chain length determinant protein WzzB [Photobacterium damselae]|uniref:LPS O-antigen chain length determinant protein WzzB n=1 Tax=Photobacterium damselae TaxID=38293 RepID=UPI000D973C4B|nr:Wzz/FepE/Etk N-terminal domain-containing protein [Photobacterium damselae]NVO73470.1 chain-length determining protein [Photobacterium damselae subsp. damselae]SPY22944.1 Ferric enterobactin transport protein fepE [Photobacterium damselae]